MLKSFLNKVWSFFGTSKESKREESAHLRKKFLKNDNGKHPVNDSMDRKNQSMKDSQGVSDFSGSGYNGPGNVDHEKRDTNMGQRNF